MRRVRLALAQVNTIVGDLAGNTALILDYADRAREAGADVVAFPELTITGYPAEDLLVRPSFISANLRTLETVAARVRGPAVVVGFVDRAGADLYNAAAVLWDGEVVGVYHKERLPNYGIFDEARYFGRGRGTPLFRMGDAWLGLNICEDIWAAGGPAARAAAAGADILLNLSASPYSRGKWRRRHAMFSTRAVDYNAVVATVNLVGGHDEVVYDGNSLVFDATGELLAEGPVHEEALLVCDIALDRVERARLREPRHRYGRPGGRGVERLTLRTDVPADRPPLPTPSPIAHDDLGEVYGALVLGTRDYVRKNGFDKVGLGVSGGIDSALAAAIAVDALGPDRVTGVSMPSRYTSEGTRTDAERLVERLGIELKTIPIESVFESTLATLAPEFEGLEPDLTEENLQARIRALLLMALANKFGWLVLTAGNKSEAAVGYSTLYGDMAGGFAVIKDVPKTLVYELARWRNGQAPEPVIPESILEREPSAELRADQRDVDSLPPYDVLDPILEKYVEQDWSEEELVAAGHDREVVRRIIRLVDRSEYKRRQAPPGVRVTARAFGRDRRYPITARYDEEA